MVIRKGNWVISELPNDHIAEKFKHWLAAALKEQVATKTGAGELGLPTKTPVEGLGFERPGAIT